MLKSPLRFMADNYLVRGIAFLLTVLFLIPAPAQAITLDEIPPDVRRRLPEFLLYMVSPQALAYLTLDDIIEYADAYEAGEFRFVAECRVESHSGPLDPELAKLVLQVPQGAPYIEKRFVRLAKEAYGRGVFSYLEWAVHENPDTSVDIQLWYAANDPEAWIPEPGYSAVGGWITGVKYQNFFYGGKDRQLAAGINFAEETTNEPGMYLSWTDNTANNSQNSVSYNLSVTNDWRRRRNLTPAVADIRQRIARADYTYSWKGVGLMGLGAESVSASAGVYNQEHFVYFGDPTAEGTAPRSDFSQEGSASYLGLAWGTAEKNNRFTPSDGFSYVLRADTHIGDFDFSRFSIDLRQYTPALNVLGIKEKAPQENGVRNSIAAMYPTASMAYQVQATISDGDVPYSQELRLGNSSILRGYSYDYYTGTKLLAARAEYRLALDGARANEAFAFTDHAWLGESLSDMESFNTWGLGGLFKLPIYGGFKVGAYMGWAFDGTDDSYGLSFGYQF